MIQDLIPDTLPHYGDRLDMRGINRLGNQVYAIFSQRGAPNHIVGTMKGDGVNPINITGSFADKDFFDPINGSKCEFNIRADSYDQWLSFATAHDTQWRVRVVEENENGMPRVLFRGFLRPETYRQNLGHYKPVVTVEATDGLGLLRHMDFPSVNEQPMFGKEPVEHIMAYILYRAGNNQNWQDHVMYGFLTQFGQQQDRNFLRTLELPVAKYYGWTLYEVLVDILSIMKAQIVQVKGNYVIRLIDKPYDLTYDEFDHKGNYLSTGERNEKTRQLYADYTGINGDLTVDRPVRLLEVENTLQAIDNLVYNGDFKHGEKGWEGWINSPQWDVKDNILRLTSSNTHTFYGSWTNAETLANVPFVRARTFDRGSVGWLPLRFLVTLEVSPVHNWTFWNFCVVLGSDIVLVQNQTEGNDGDYYKTVHIVMHLQPGAERHVAISQGFRFSNPPGPESAVVESRLDVKNVRVQCLGTGQWPFESYVIENNDELPAVPDNITRQTEVEIELSNTEEKSVDVAWGQGNEYKFDNGLRNTLIYHRDTGVVTLLWNMIQNRLEKYYEQARRRADVSFYMKQYSEHVYPYSKLFDSKLSRVFVPLSYTYDLLYGQYRVEMIEHRQAEDHELMTWILRNGVWDDGGYWIDSKVWND